jgi:hypothetical protein
VPIRSYTVNPEAATELALPGYDVDGDQVSVWLTSLPSHGNLFEVSSNYALYGYEPKQGNRIEAANLTHPYRLQDSKARLVYMPPASAQAPIEQPWATFKYLANDGRENGSAATVWLLAPHQRVVASNFDEDADGWTVIENGAAAAQKDGGGILYSKTSWNLLQWYISGAEDEVHEDPLTGDDRSLWKFVAPAKFSGQHTIAYGGKLRLTMGAFAGEFTQQNKPLVAIRLLCANCSYNLGESFVVLQDSAHFKFHGGVLQVEIPLVEEAWLRDPKSSIEEYEAITQCELIEALSHLSGMHITADFTQRYESVAIDDVEIIAGGGECAPIQSAHHCIPH